VRKDLALGIHFLEHICNMYLCVIVLISSDHFRSQFGPTLPPRTCLRLTQMVFLWMFLYKFQY